MFVTAVSNPFVLCFASDLTQVLDSSPTNQNNTRMIVATCIVTLDLAGVSSLKEKRRIVKSIIARLRQQFNIAAAEVDHQDVWQTAVLGIAAVGNETAHLHSCLEKVINWLDNNRPDAPIADYTIEFY